MGLLSIALVVGPITLVNPEGVTEFQQHPWDDPRRFVVILAIVVAGSTGASYALARVRILRSTARYTPTVWTTTFEERPGFVRQVMVELTDRRQFQGTLLACTLDPSVEQQVAICAPIRRIDSGGQDLAQERMAFASSVVASISMVYTPDGFPPLEPPDRTLRARVTDSVRVGWSALGTEWHRSSRATSNLPATDRSTDATSGD